MIVRPSIAFSDFSGSAKGVTAQSTKGRTILSSKSQHGSITTPAQAVSRNTLSRISRSYKQLSDSQMKGWETLAGKMKRHLYIRQDYRLDSVLYKRDFDKEYASKYIIQ